MLAKDEGQAGRGGRGGGGGDRARAGRRSRRANRRVLGGYIAPLARALLTLSTQTPARTARATGTAPAIALLNLLQQPLIVKSPVHAAHPPTAQPALSFQSSKSPPRAPLSARALRTCSPVASPTPLATLPDAAPRVSPAAMHSLDCARSSHICCARSQNSRTARAQTGRPTIKVRRSRNQESGVRM